MIDAQRQPHFAPDWPSIRTGRHDQFEAAATFVAIDQGLLARIQAVDHVLVVRLVTEAVNVRRIDREPLHHVGVALQSVDELPSANLVDGKAGNLDRASGAEHRERSFEVSRTRGAGRFDDAERAIAKADRGHRGVFGLDVHQRGRPARMHALDLAHEPPEHVDMMAGLIGDHAAVLGPGAAPRILIVVALVAAPAHAHRAEHELAEASGIERFARFDDGHVEAVLLDDEQPYACIDRKRAIIASASSRRSAIGFSTTTCRPVRATATTCSACMPLGVNTDATSMPGIFSISAIDSNAGTPYLSPKASARSRRTSHTAASRAPPICPVPSRSAWRLAIRPQPIKAN